MPSRLLRGIERHRARSALIGVLAVAAVAPLIAFAGPAATTAGPSFTRDVAPIVSETCTGCHRLGGIAPFAFRTARDLTSRAQAVRAMVEGGLMPPWPPGPASPAYVGQERRTLSTDQRSTLLHWLAQAPARAAGTIRPSPPPTVKPRNDERVLSLQLPKTYSPAAAGGGTDDYRCFLLDPGLASDAFVTSARIEPGNAALVHHVILFRVPATQATEARALDARVAGPGWQCFGGTGISLSDGPGGNPLDDAPWIAAWAPGWGGDRLPDGLGIPLPRGSLIVMQVHYNLLNGRAQDRSKAVLTVMPATSKLTKVETMLLPAPVELPCAAGEVGTLCKRDSAVADQARRIGPSAPLVAAGLLFLCGKNINQPPTGSTTSCDRQISRPTTIRAVAGHMHLLGQSVRLELNPGTPRARLLLDIPRWDFHWQAMYTLAHKVVARPGDVLRVSCSHDATKRAAIQPPAARTPRYVLWGEGTTDEMCLGVVQVTRG